MSIFPPAVERWRTLTELEISKLAGRSRIVPPPVQLMLAVIQHESGGIPGIPSGVPAVGGRAMGLTQVIPSALDTYNGSNPKVTPEQLAGSSPSDCAAQIRVGAWLLGRQIWNVQAWFAAESETVSQIDLLRLGAASYAVGWGRVRGVMIEAQNAGLAPSWGALLKLKGENWLHPPNWPVRYATIVTRWHPDASLDSSSGGEQPIPWQPVDPPVVEESTFRIPQPLIVVLAVLAIGGAAVILLRA